MSVDRFGSSRSASSKRELKHLTIARDGKGNYQFKKRRLCNIQEPEDEGDATTKHYVDTLSTSSDNRMQEFAEKTCYENMNKFEIMLRKHIEKSLEAQYQGLMVYLNKNELKRDEQNNIILENIRIKSLLPPENDDDVPNMKYVTDYINSKTPAIDTNGDLSFNHRRLINIAEPLNDSDAVNKKYFRHHVRNAIDNLGKEFIKPLMDDVTYMKERIQDIYGIFHDMRGQLIVPLQTRPFKGSLLRYMLTSGLDYYTVAISGDLIECSMISSPQPFSRSGTLIAINSKIIESYPAVLNIGDRITFTAPPNRAKDGHILNISLKIAYRLINRTI